MLRFVNETVGADGSYSALVHLYGVEYAVHYVNEEVRVYATTITKFGPKWKARRNPATVKKLVTEKIKSFGPEFAAAHKALYAEDESAA